MLTAILVMKGLYKLLDDHNLKRLEIGKSRVYNSGSSEAVWTAEFLFKQIFKDKREYLKPSFVYALCSIIEENLNCNFIDYFYSKFGEEYKSYVTVFIKMSIHDKFKIAIPVISNYKYDLNHEKKEIKGIKQLFEIRNQLIHIKNHYRSTLWFETNDGKFCIKELDENELSIYDRVKYQKLDKEVLKEFYRAQREFTPKFHQLFQGMQRKNFNPQDWFIKLEKKEKKVSLKRKKN
jgi:hypothetical protein